MATSKPTIKAYQAAADEADESISRIQKLLADHAARFQGFAPKNSETGNWGHVGDLVAAVSHLHNVETILGGNNEE